MGSRKTVITILLLTLTVLGVLSAVCMESTASHLLTSETVPVDDSEAAVLRFGVGVHIEPLRGQGAGQRDYNNGIFFERHVEDIRILAEIVERYGGKLTIQAQTPFTLVAVQSGETLFADLEGRGHEIALHFHEDAHLGRNPESLPVSTWADSMTQEISYLEQAGATKVRYWSGGNLYPGILEAASLSGLDVMSDWKNPHSQQTDTLVIGVNPWRPSGGPSEKDLSAFANTIRKARSSTFQTANMILNCSPRNDGWDREVGRRHTSPSAEIALSAHWRPDDRTGSMSFISPSI